ncbi:MAG: hypothetical protein IPK95_13390 [Cellvibrionales bacterium]|nr:hypothetical protein [Cellvibrionales bacterium]
MRIVDLAAGDERRPTRLCVSVARWSCRGFQDFKLALAQELATTVFGKVAESRTPDSVADFSRKIFDSTIDTLLKVRDNLNPGNIHKAITALTNANRVEFYGHGASAAVAADAPAFRLRRLPLHVPIPISRKCRRCPSER